MKQHKQLLFFCMNALSITKIRSFSKRGVNFQISYKHSYFIPISSLTRLIYQKFKYSVTNFFYFNSQSVNEIYFPKNQKGYSSATNYTNFFISCFLAHSSPDTCYFVQLNFCFIRLKLEVKLY